MPPDRPERCGNRLARAIVERHGSQREAQATKPRHLPRPTAQELRRAFLPFQLAGRSFCNRPRPRRRRPDAAQPRPFCLTFQRGTQLAGAAGEIFREAAAGDRRTWFVPQRDHSTSQPPSRKACASAVASPCSSGSGERVTRPAWASGRGRAASSALASAPATAAVYPERIPVRQRPKPVGLCASGSTGNCSPERATMMSGVMPQTSSQPASSRRGRRERRPAARRAARPAPDRAALP